MFCLLFSIVENVVKVEVSNETATSLMSIVQVCNMVETRLGHPGHILSWLSMFNLLYKISGSDPDSALHHVH